MEAQETRTIKGTFGPDGEPILKAKVYLPNGVDPVEIEMRVSTGTTQTIIAAPDWQRAGFHPDEYQWRQWAITGRSVQAAKDVDVTLVMNDTEEGRHFRHLPVMLLAPGEGLHSVAGTDLLANASMTMNAQAGVLILVVPEPGLPVSPVE